MAREIRVQVVFSGGLEALFDNITHHSVSFPEKTSSGSGPTVGDLVQYLVDVLMKDSRKELFVRDGAIRPGVFVMINESDWELEGEEKYELRDNDEIIFVSTLHGG